MIEKKPWRITIDTNPDQCNLNCIMCDTHSIYATKKSVKRKRMEATLLREILIEAKKIGVKEIIPSTMGEPLLYPYFQIFIDEISQSNIKLNLTTNGTFPKLGAEAWGKKLLPITSDTKISINGISPNVNEKVMVNAQTEEVLNNIKTYLTIRDSLQSQPNPPTVTLQVTFMKSNLEGIREVIEFAIKHKVNRVKGHHLWVNWQQLETENMRHPDNIAIWNQFINSIARRHIKLENFDKLAEKSNLERLIPDAYECPFLGQELWIDQDGNYNVCCAPSEKRVTLGDFGSFKEMGILERYNSKPYKELCLNYKTKEICQTCLLRKAC
jgi:MoaA/NifB/PqqE/SkfB family radical SAM enzyme